MKFSYFNLLRPNENIERALRRPQTTPKVDEDLHGLIMGAVREARREENRTERAPIFGWWATAGAGIALAALSLGLWLRTMTPPPLIHVASNDLAQAPATALDFGAQLPALVMSPYSNEWARVDHDLHTTTQDLLASLP